MEPFEIDYYGVIFTILPQMDGSFTIFNQQNLLGTISPEITDEMDVRWTSKDMGDNEFSAQVGALIENYYNGY